MSQALPYNSYIPSTNNALVCLCRLGSDNGEDLSQSIVSDIDAGESLDIDLDGDCDPQKPAQPHLLHPRYSYSYPSASAQAGPSSVPEQAHSRKPRIGSRTRSLPTWHSSHLVSKHPFKYNLETCAACLASLEREKLEIEQIAGLIPSQKERRLAEIDNASECIQANFPQAKLTYAQSKSPTGTRSASTPGIAIFTSVRCRR